MFLLSNLIAYTILGFAFGVIAGLSVFITLDISYGNDTTFINTEIYTCLFVAGVTNAIITYIAHSFFNVSNPSTERNDDDDYDDNLLDTNRESHC